MFFLVDACKRLSWADCDDPVKVFSGCNQYVFDRLLTCCVGEGLTVEQCQAIAATVKREELL